MGKNKKVVSRSHAKNKRAKELKRKRKINALKKHKRSIKNAPKIDIEQFLFRYAVENMANVSFSYLEKGTNYYLSNEEVDLTLETFLAERKADTYFSCGVRGLIVDGDLQVSKPLTWVPEAENPTVKDYLAELWNKEEEEKGATQINSFTFFLYDDEDFEGEDNEYGDHFLVCSVIVSGDTRDNINGYLVMREAYEKEGQLCLEGKNLFLDHQDVLSVIVPPMISPIKDEPNQEEQNVESKEGSEEGGGDEQV